MRRDVEFRRSSLPALTVAALGVVFGDIGTSPLYAVKETFSPVHGMTKQERDLSIVSAILSLARALRLKVVAEGVETEVDATILRDLGCQQAQGFFFSRPLPVEKFEELLQPV